MRIITGSARGAILATLEGEATRPTADRVKEALFSMIQFDVEGRTVLDLFAGSGQLGLEALSRGAESATFIDESRQAGDIIIQNAKKTHLFGKCRISTCDYKSFLRGASGREKYDIIFLDPPYASGFTADALERLTDSGILKPHTLIVCENDTPVPKKRGKKRESDEDTDAAVLRDVFLDDSATMAKYRVVKSNAYGRTRITVLEPSEVSDDE